MPKSSLLRSAAGLALAAACASPLAAQGVRGALVDETTQRPIAGAIVGLVDSTGREVESTLSSETGRFALRAPAPGAYTLRSRRIGVRSVASPALRLEGAGWVDYTFLARTEPIPLASVLVTARPKQCDVRPAEGAAAAVLFDEARKALDAAAITQRERQFAVTMRRFSRQLNPKSLKVEREEMATVSGMTENPFVSAPAATLAAEGYARETAGGIEYYAPDAPALLSSEFADGHCLRARREDAEHRGLAGLAFEPVRRRGAPRVDIEGTLWLDAGTAELRYLEYRYTGLPSGVPDDKVGGRIDFRRLPSGGWIVERWSIRAPAFTVIERPPLPGQSSRDRREYKLATLHETGGSVSGPVVDARPATIAGVVFDSTRGAPLAGARVFLSGTSHVTRTDSTGHFTLDGLAPGTYSLSFLHARLDSLEWVAPGMDVSAEPGAPREVALGIPASAKGVAVAVATAPPPRRLLPPGGRGTIVAAPGAPAVFGVLTDQEERPIPEATVSIVGTSLTTRTRADGSFRLPAPPPGEHRLAARHLAYRPLAVILAVEAGRSTEVVGVMEMAPQPIPERVVASRDRTGFDERRRQGRGYFIDASDIEQRGTPRFSELLRTVPGVRLVPTGGQLGAKYRIEMGRSSASMNLRPRIVSPPPPPPGREQEVAGTPTLPADPGNMPTTALMPVPGRESCTVNYWLDGVRFEPTNGDVDVDVRPDQIAGLEVYPGLMAPAQYRTGDMVCGVIVIWTKMNLERRSASESKSP
jgi:hypothetical protein